MFGQKINTLHGKFLGKHNLETDILKKLKMRITVHFKVKLTIKNFPQKKKKTLSSKKTAGPDAFPWEFYQTFREEIIVILHKIL
jgi:hypothetical protein